MWRWPEAGVPNSVGIDPQNTSIEPVRPYGEQGEGFIGVVPWKWVKGNSYPLVPNAVRVDCSIFNGKRQDIG